jgi:hypothetical protein
MRILDTAFSMLRHGTAALCSIGLLTIIPIIIYIIAAAVSNDPGGPLNFVLVPLLSLALGIGTTFFVYFPIGLFFQWLSRRRKIPAWLPLVMFFSFSILAFVIWGALTVNRPTPLRHLGLAVFFASFFTVGFVGYWLALVFGKKADFSKRPQS